MHNSKGAYRTASQLQAHACHASGYARFVGLGRCAVSAEAPTALQGSSSDRKGQSLGAHASLAAKAALIAASIPLCVD